MRGWGRVAVGVRIGQRPDPVFFDSWTGLVASGLKTGDAILPACIGLPHATAANMLAAQFAESPCDSILYVDDDVVFEPGALTMLREAGDEYGMVTGIIPCRRGSMLPIALRGKPLEKAQPVRSYGVTMEEVDCVGLAFTLIRRTVFEGVLKLRGRDEPFVWDNALGEDGEFCDAASRLGWKIGVDPRLNIGHRMMAVARYDVTKQETKITVDGR